jgi:hypothetical protein
MYGLEGERKIISITKSFSPLVLFNSSQSQTIIYYRLRGIPVIIIVAEEEKIA